MRDKDSCIGIVSGACMRVRACFTTGVMVRVTVTVRVCVTVGIRIKARARFGITIFSMSVPDSQRCKGAWERRPARGC